MVFNSISFLAFFIIAFAIYWGVLKNHLKAQNLFVLIASYVFYGFWDWRFLGLIAFSSIVDYFVGIRIHEAENSSTKKLYLIISLFVNLGLLGIFKYYNFFVESLEQFLYNMGSDLNFKTLHILLPVGISFYTFQTLSYSIDIYRGSLKPTRNVVSFFAFVSFFPQLVAGPIERAKNLLPQFLEKRQFEYQNALQSSRQILWGMFKKVVIADNCAIYVDQVFENYAVLPGWLLIIGALLFALQLYGDFSGYSDIAIGVAGLLGFKLLKNFDTPYFATSISDLWRRWHISLSSWAMDYIFLPLNTWMGRKFKGIYLALFLTFLILGVWHGANWTFFAFGLIHGVAIIIERLMKWDRVKESSSLLRKVAGWLFAMSIWLIGVVFFRSATVADALAYLQGFCYLDGSKYAVDNIFFDRLIQPMPKIFTMTVLAVIISVVIMLAFEWRNRGRDFGLAKMSSKVALRYPVYFFLVFMIIEYFNADTTFIYFQF